MTASNLTSSCLLLPKKLKENFEECSAVKIKSYIFLMKTSMHVVIKMLFLLQTIYIPFKIELPGSCSTSEIYIPYGSTYPNLILAVKNHNQASRNDTKLSVRLHGHLACNLCIIILQHFTAVYVISEIYMRSCACTCR